MNKRENFLSLVRRKGYEKVPVDFFCCPSLDEKFKEYKKQNKIEVDWYTTHVWGLTNANRGKTNFKKYYNVNFKEGTEIDEWGIAHEQGSEFALHMTKMYHPMEKFDSIEQIKAYEFPDFMNSPRDYQFEQVNEAIKNDFISMGSMQTTIWETAWYLRGMENLMMDMMSEDPMAEVLLDKVTDLAVMQASAFAEAGADVIFLGDDIGMQSTILMSESLYCDWIKPRLKKVIDAAKKIKPDIVVFYHSCGFVTPLIPHLIDAGIDVLNPVQPECMDFKEIHDQYGDKLSFNGTIGTQSTMPFGTPDDVRREVFKNLDIASDKGGLLVAPTHMLEPEVPVENVAAYIKACQDYK